MGAARRLKGPRGHAWRRSPKRVDPNLADQLRHEVATWSREVCEVWLIENIGERYRPEVALAKWGVVFTDEMLRGHCVLHQLLAAEGIDISTDSLTFPEPAETRAG